MEWGSILCGYGEGSMEASPGEGDKSVLFSLPSAEAAVFYNKEVSVEGRDLQGGLACRAWEDKEGSQGICEAVRLQERSGFEKVSCGLAWAFSTAKRCFSLPVM